MPAGKPKPKFPPNTDERAQIVTLAAAGHSQVQISKSIGRSRRLVKNVLNEPETQQAVSDEKAELAALCRSRSRECVVAIDAEKISKSSALQLATAAGILLDKSLLLSGEPTENVNIRVLFEIAQLIRQQEDDKSDRHLAEYRGAHALPAPNEEPKEP